MVWLLDEDLKLFFFQISSLQQGLCSLTQRTHWSVQKALCLGIRAEIFPTGWKNDHNPSWTTLLHRRRLLRPHLPFHCLRPVHLPPPRRPLPPRRLFQPPPQPPQHRSFSVPRGIRVHRRFHQGKMPSGRKRRSSSRRRRQALRERPGIFEVRSQGF
jgi:hypothetical protein